MTFPNAKRRVDHLPSTEQITGRIFRAMRCRPAGERNGSRISRHDVGDVGKALPDGPSSAGSSGPCRPRGRAAECRLVPIPGAPSQPSLDRNEADVRKEADALR